MASLLDFLTDPSLLQSYYPGRNAFNLADIPAIPPLYARKFTDRTTPQPPSDTFTGGTVPFTGQTPVLSQFTQQALQAPVQDNGPSPAAPLAAWASSFGGPAVGLGVAPPTPTVPVQRDFVSMNTQPAPGLPQVSPPSSFLGGLGNVLQKNPLTLMALGAGLAGGEGIGGALSAAVPVAAAERKTFETQRDQMIGARAIAEGLIGNGVDPNRAIAIGIAAMKNNEVAKAVLPEALGTQKPSGTIKIGDIEVPYNLKGDQLTLLTPGGGSKIGSLEDLIKVGQDIKSRGKQQEATASELGKEQGQAIGALQQAKVAADKTIQNVNDLLTRPGRNLATGPVLGHLPPIAGAQADFINRFNQIKNEAFLTVFPTLKGGGSVSNAEGTKATAALNRMERSLNDPKAFDDAAKDYIDAVKAGYDALQNKAQGKFGIGQPLANPWQQLPDGYRLRERQP